MRIGIDARELCGQATGVGRYLEGLLKVWNTASEARSHEFVLYAPHSLDLELDGRRFFTRTVAGAGGTWWEQIQLPAATIRDHLDVFFSPAYSTALRQKTPTVVALHDLSFVAHPEWFTAREGVRRRWLARRSAAKARAVITISEFSKRELLDRLGVPAGRIHVIPPGVSSLPRQSPSAPAAEPRILYVGSIFNRRHVPDLVRAFAPIARQHPQATLDIVGDNRTYPRQNVTELIAREGLRGQLRWRSYVADEELAHLYATSRVFAFLSEYEGLGLTPLEALAAGVPPVLLDTPVARESCGKAAVYVSLSDPKAITAALEQLLFDELERTALLAAAPAVLSRYEWPRAARETLAVLERAV